MIMKKTHDKSFFTTCDLVDFVRFFDGENPKNGHDDVIVLQASEMTHEYRFLLEIVKKEDYNKITATFENVDIDFPCALAEPNTGSDGNHSGYCFSKQPYPVTTGG